MQAAATMDGTGFARVDGVTSEWSADRVVVLDAAGETMTTLSPVGALIWDRLPADVPALVDHLRERFPDVDPSLLTTDTRAFLAELRDTGLVVETDAAG
jgi:hypothetical protein